LSLKKNKALKWISGLDGRGIDLRIDRIEWSVAVLGMHLGATHHPLGVVEKEATEQDETAVQGHGGQTWGKQV